VGRQAGGYVLREIVRKGLTVYVDYVNPWPHVRVLKKVAGTLIAMVRRAPPAVQYGLVDDGDRQAAIAITL